MSRGVSCCILFEPFSFLLVRILFFSTVQSSAHYVIPTARRAPADAHSAAQSQSPLKRTLTITLSR